MSFFERQPHKQFAYKGGGVKILNPFHHRYPSVRNEIIRLAVISNKQLNSIFRLKKFHVLEPKNCSKLIFKAAELLITNFCSHFT